MQQYTGLCGKTARTTGRQLSEDVHWAIDKWTRLAGMHSYGVMLSCPLTLLSLGAGYFTFWVIISIIWGLVRPTSHCAYRDYSS